MDDMLEFRTRSDEPTPLRVLIVEDNQDDEYVAKRTLARILPMAQIECVKTIGDAYKICRKSPYDLILLDLNLPDGFGPNSVQEVRKFFKGSTIFVLTGLASPLTIQLVLEKGANKIFTKSQINTPEFENALRGLRAA